MQGRRIAEDRLHEHAFDLAPDGLLVVRADGVVSLANRRAAELLGGEPDQIAGCKVDLLVTQPPAVGAPETQCGVRRLDGVELRVLVRRTDLGAGRSLLTLRETVGTELDALRERAQLLATLSHELRTPLTSIVGYSELLSELGADQLSAEARRLVDVVRRHAEREVRLVEDMLTLAYVDGPLQQADRLPVDLGRLVRPLVEEAGRDAAVPVTLRAAPAPRVTADERGLAQVVAALLSNAVTFTPAGGAVAVRVGHVGDQVVLEVEDSGIGIPEHELPRVFDPLFRGEAAAERNAHGAGLGLAIARAVVEGLGGVIEVDSIQGEGSLFRLRLPALPCDAESPVVVPFQR